MRYRFKNQNDASWNSQNRQAERYGIIQGFLGQGAQGAEIGVYRGGFGEFLLPHCAKLFLVDPWSKLKSHWDTDGGAVSCRDAEMNIRSVYSAEIKIGQVSVVRDFGSSFLRSQPDRSLDWVYIDASHRFDSTLEEIELSLQKVKIGGYIIGDDYDENPDSNQHGVYLAVNQVLDTTGKSLLLARSRQFVLEV